VIDAKGDYVEVLEEYPNLAPAEDAVLVDLTGSGQVCRIPLFPDKETDAFILVPGGYMFRRGLFWEHQGSRSRSQPARSNVCTRYRRDFGFPTSTNLPWGVSLLLMISL